jgi:hypothetical protein
MECHIDHVGVVVRDMAVVEAPVMRDLEMPIEQVVHLPELKQSAPFYRSEGAALELIELADIEARNRRLRPGAMATLDHLGFAAPSIEEAAARLRAHGVVLSTPSGDDEPVRIGNTLHLWSDRATTAGIRLQLVQRK